MVVISISIPDSLARRVDEVLGALGFTSRSELVREAIRRFLDQVESVRSQQYKVYIVSILSDHRVHPASDRRILEVIHSYQAIVRGFYHQLLGDGLCVNVAILETQWPLLSRMLRDIRSVKGVLDVEISGLAIREEL